tara:strand:- start:2765 stop:3028 length:264 start_codon:yes stop_codon:yes gene_type:complete
MKERIKRFLSDLWYCLVIVTLIAVLSVPLVLPLVTAFHPLLVVPYYGTLWWIAGMHFLTRKHLSIKKRKKCCPSKKSVKEFHDDFGV